jgi:hypothetical protein
VVSTQQVAASNPFAPTESDRVRLARTALAAALGVPGVAGVDSGADGAFVTETGRGERLPGVTCVAAPGGGYDVSLRLIGGLVALHPLGDQVRTAVMRASALAGVAVGAVSVHFAEIAPAGEWR